MTANHSTSETSLSGGPPDRAAASGAEDADNSPQFVAQVIDRWEDLEPLRPEWDRLAQHALEPSPSAESWTLIPALRYLVSEQAVRVVLIFREADTAGGPRALCGIFPVEFRSRYKGLPIGTVRIWDHLYSLAAAPLMHASHATQCVRAFLAWASHGRPRATLVEFPELRPEGAFFRVLSEVLRQDDIASLVTDLHSRAIFRPRESIEDYLSGVGNAHHRKETRRQERRLSELGELRYEQLPLGEDPDSWVNEFVALEMQGWKGRQGTAFGCDPKHHSYLTEMVRAAQASGRLMILVLRLNGQAVAMKLNVLAAPGSFSFKIAYDEAYSKYSPGVLLELENIRRLHASRTIGWMDSLALADHPMLDRLWLDQTAIATLLVAPNSRLGEIILGGLPLMRAVKRAIVFRR